MKDLSPIVCFTYKRLDNTKRMFESLSQNALSKNSELFVFADGYKGNNDKSQVLAVHDYVKTLNEKKWFKSVTVYCQSENRGLGNSVIAGVSKVFEKYDKLIVCEDDLNISPVFLDYMNECLDYYRDDKRIWGIGAYSDINMEEINEKYTFDVYIAYGCSTWGWGTWKERWTNIDWNIKDYYWKFLLFPWLRYKINRASNLNFSMLRAQNKRKLDSWAIRRLCYMCMSNYQYGIYPTQTLVKNEGFGEDATHTKREMDKLEELENNKKDWAISNIQCDKQIIKAIKRKKSMSIIDRIKDKFINKR